MSIIYNTGCSSCFENNLVKDSSGDIICTDCGLVVESDNIISEHNDNTSQITYPENQQNSKIYDIVSTLQVPQQICIDASDIVLKTCGMYDCVALVFCICKHTYNRPMDVSDVAFLFQKNVKRLEKKILEIESLHYKRFTEQNTSRKQIEYWIRYVMLRRGMLKSNTVFHFHKSIEELMFSSKAIACSILHLVHDVPVKEMSIDVSIHHQTITKTLRSILSLKLKKGVF
jgi:hypothetical protein